CRFEEEYRNCASDVYPAAQQMLIHQGKVLKHGTTMEENKVFENSFIVIMLSKVPRIGYLTLNNCLSGNKLSSSRSHDDEGIVDKL
ncbi:hypothetical protein R6Q59_007023, partial [Mikania micrantha]